MLQNRKYKIIIIINTFPIKVHPKNNRNCKYKFLFLSSLTLSRGLRRFLEEQPLLKDAHKMAEGGLGGPLYSGLAKADLLVRSGNRINNSACHQASSQAVSLVYAS